MVSTLNKSKTEDVLTIDLRKCDGCGKDSDSVEQSSCLTSYVEEDKYKFKFKSCPNDFFYCKYCMEATGNFCNDCAKDISKENQEIIVKDLA